MFRKPKNRATKRKKYNHKNIKKKGNMKEEIRNCRYCNAEFITTNNKKIYCSRNCGAYYTKKHKKEVYKIICKNCNSEFESRDQTKVFCSSDCKTEYYIKNPIMHEYVLTCNNCGKTFVKILANNPNLKNENHYCSQKCVGVHKNKIGIGTKFNCRQCGKEFEQIHKKHFFCTEECKTAYWTVNAPTKIVKCATCGNDIVRLRHLKNERYFCSTECDIKWREKQSEDIRVCKYCKKEFTCKKSEKLVFCSKACQISGMNKSPTKPHRDIIAFLDEYELLYEIEKPIKRYSIDIYLLDYDLSIEIMGQYWHCDNRLYEHPKNKAQLDGIKKDKKKNKYFEDNNLSILYLWEIDINKNIEVCKKLIIEFIENCGVLDNYHSMNYKIENEELILSDKILIPYFEKYDYISPLTTETRESHLI
jgi:G:T-mismatch repair DNA endonuclease (very short patch repair protein)